MKKSTSVLVKIAIVTTLTLVASLQAQAECSHVLFQQNYEVASVIKDAHPNTQFHTDPTLHADYGVRLVSTPDTTKITDPFGNEHSTGGGLRYEIFKDGRMVQATQITPDSVMDLGFLRQQLNQILTQLGCR